MCECRWENALLGVVVGMVAAMAVALAALHVRGDGVVVSSCISDL